MMKIHLKTKYLDEEAILRLGKYSNGSTAISFISLNGEPLSTATVSLGGIIPCKGCTFIKDWSENEGILKCLIKNDLVKLTGREEKAGFCVAKEVKLSSNILE